MRQAVLEAVLQPGATELQIAQAYEAMVRQVAPMLGPLCEDVLRVQLRHTIETEAVNVAERAAGSVPGARSVAVAFADLVGFTRLGEAVPPAQLETLANRLSVLARDVASPPVHFIKTIGDAVMLASVDPVALLRGCWICSPPQTSTRTCRSCGSGSRPDWRSVAPVTGSAAR